MTSPADDPLYGRRLLERYMTYLINTEGGDFLGVVADDHLPAQTLADLRAISDGLNITWTHR